MVRYLRLYGYFLRFSISKALEFRADFFFRIVMDAFYYAVNILFFKVIFGHTKILAGWDESQVMVFVGGYLVADAINMTVFANNIWALPQMVNKGDLDYYLLRPVSSLFFLSLRDFAFNSFVNLIMAFGILLWAIEKLTVPFGTLQLILFCIYICLGSLIFFFVRMLFILPVFWTHSGRGFDYLFWPLTRFLERPDRIFSGWLRIILLTILPFSVMSSLPARLVLEPFSWPVLAHLVSVTLVFFLLLTQIWKVCLKNYSSASS